MNDTPAPLSADSLRELDKFMFSMGFELYASLENTQPWNTRYYRHNTLELRDGRKSTYLMTVDSAMFWHEMFAAALQSQRQRIADSLPEKLALKKDESDSDYFYGYGWNAAIEAVRAVLIPPTPRGGKEQDGDSK